MTISFPILHCLFSLFLLRLVSNSVYQVESEEHSSEESGEIGNPECMLCEQLIKEAEKRAESDKSKVRQFALEFQSN